MLTTPARDCLLGRRREAMDHCAELGLCWGVGGTAEEDRPPGQGGGCRARRRWPCHDNSPTGVVGRWTADWSFLNSKRHRLGLRRSAGMPQVLDRLARTKDLCATGSAAARTFLPRDVTPVVPVTQLTLYARDPQDSPISWADPDRPGLTAVFSSRLPVPALIEQPERSADGMPRAPLGVVLADLFSLPGRSAQEAEQLIDVLAADDPTWRRCRPPRVRRPARRAGGQPPHRIRSSERSRNDD